MCRKTQVAIIRKSRIEDKDGKYKERRKRRIESDKDISKKCKRPSWYYCRRQTITVKERCFSQVFTPSSLLSLSLQFSSDSIQRPML